MRHHTSHKPSFGRSLDIAIPPCAAPALGTDSAPRPILHFENFFAARKLLSSFRTKERACSLANRSMKLKKILSKSQKYLLVIALLLSSVAISIRSNDGKISLVLSKYPALIFLLIVVSSFLVAIYFYTTTKKISSLSSQIKEQSKITSEGMDALLSRLTERQRKVYDLILLGKTNKEIMSELFIEQSTLKSHINQIYKKLDIKNRRELKSTLNP